MSSNLYEILGISRDATTEEIRKAYKKRALATHPDRFAGKSEAEKSLAEEQFRKVNNAYEVLSDETKRQAYNIHGVWPVPDQFDPPPPYPGRNRHSSEHPRHRYHYDPFFTFTNSFNNLPEMPNNSFNRHHHHHHHDLFTDPFVLFDSIFGDFGQHFMDEFQPRQRSNLRHRRHDSFGSGFPFGPNGMGGMLRGMGMSTNMFAAFPTADLGPGPGSGRTRWRQESRATTTVNGVVTHSKWTRVDSDGNEHVTRTFPDGREEYLINGRIQPTEERGFLPGPPPNSMHHHDYNADAVPPPPIITGRPSRSHHPSPEYDGPYNSAAVRPHDNWNDRDYGPTSERKRWWRGGR